MLKIKKNKAQKKKKRAIRSKRNKWWWVCEREPGRSCKEPEIEGDEKKVERVTHSREWVKSGRILEVGEGPRGVADNDGGMRGGGEAGWKGGGRWDDGGVEQSAILDAGLCCLLLYFQAVTQK